MHNCIWHDLINLMYLHFTSVISHQHSFKDDLTALHVKLFTRAELALYVHISPDSQLSVFWRGTGPIPQLSGRGPSGQQCSVVTLAGS